MADKRVDAANRALFGADAGTGRRAAQEASASKRDLDRVKARETAEKAFAAKTAKLRALRLAKEAEDAERARDEASRAKPSGRKGARAEPVATTPQGEG